MKKKVQSRSPEIGASCRKDIRDEYPVFHAKAEQYTDAALRRVEEMRSAFYGGVDPRRRQEMADAGMVREDRNAMANLSGQAVHREYPKVPFYGNIYIDDMVEY